MSCSGCSRNNKNKSGTKSRKESNMRKKKTYNCKSCKKKFTSCTIFEKCPFCEEDIKQSKNLVKKKIENKMVKDEKIETKKGD